MSDDDSSWDIQNSHAKASVTDHEIIKSMIQSASSCVKKNIKPEDYIALCNSIVDKFVALEKYRIDKDCELKLTIKDRELASQSTQANDCTEDKLECIMKHIQDINTEISQVKTGLCFQKLTQQSPVQSVIEKVMSQYTPGCVRTIPKAI